MQSALMVLGRGLQQWEQGRRQAGGGGAFPLSMDQTLQFQLQLHRQMGKSTPAYSLKVELI